jgi:hypothetical protein
MAGLKVRSQKIPDWGWRQRVSGFDAVFYSIAAAFDDHGFGVVDEPVENGVSFPVNGTV